ncbi:MAG: hypothetical protein AB7E42_02285 [Anaerotignaceae bacterium]
MSLINYKNAKHNKDGEIGEEIVLDYFKSNKNIIDFEDVRNVDGYQKKDIDFIVKIKVNNEIETHKIEVKTDIQAGQYENFFVEKSNFYLMDCKYIDKDGNEVVIAKKGETTKGWMFYSECDYFFFYVPAHDKIYICAREILRKYIAENQPVVRKCKDYHKITDGWCVKIKDLIRKNINDVIVLDGKAFTVINNDAKEVA